MDLDNTQPLPFGFPTDIDVRLAKESVPRLTEFSARKKSAPVKLRLGGAEGEEITMPMAACRLRKDILLQMAEGSAVSVVPHQAELTTQQAAELLGVSRPFLVEQLDKGLIPHRKVGTHRRVLLKDLLIYKQQMAAGRLHALEELSALDQELGLGY